MTNLYGKNRENGTGAVDVRSDFCFLIMSNFSKRRRKKRKRRKGKKEGRKDNPRARIRYFFKESFKIKELVLSDAGGWLWFMQVTGGITSIMTWIF